MSSPLVSVCIPTYNAARTIARTLASVLAQTYANIEVNISDNASTDDTLAIVEAFGDPRVRIFRRETTSTAEENFERCLCLGTGAYTTIYHADDEYAPEAVATCLAFLEANPDCGAVFTAARLIDEGGADRGGFPQPRALFDGPAPVRLGAREVLQLVLAHGNFMPCPSLFARSEVLRGAIKTWNGKDFRSSADLDVWLRLAAARPLGFVATPVLRYRKSDLQFSHQYNFLRTRPADLLLVLEYYVKSSPLGRQLTPTDLANYEKLLHKDLVVCACNSLLADQPQRASELIGSIPFRLLVRRAGSSAREGKVLLSWLLVRLGLTPLRLLVQPLLWKIARQTA